MSQRRAGAAAAGRGGLERGQGRWRGLRVAVAALVASAGLSGCANFFPAQTDSGSGGGGGSSGSGAVTGQGPNAVYVLNQTTQTVYGYTISSSGLAAVNGISLGYTPLAAVVSRDGTSLYVAGAGVISRYAINTSTGALSVPSVTNVALSTDVSLDVSPDGKWMFGLNTPNQQVDVFGINSDGSLAVGQPAGYTPASGTVVPKQVLVAPSGAYVFAALGTGGEVVFTFNTSSGFLSMSQTLGTGSTQTGDNAIAVDPTSTYLYVARSGVNAGLNVFTIGSQGFLSSISGSPFGIGAGASSVVVGPSGKTVYVANRADGTISEFTVGTGGALTAVSGSPIAAGSLVSSLGLDSTGTFLLAASYGGLPDVAMYSFDATTAGKLDTVTTAAAGSDPAGSFLVAVTH